MSLLHNRWIADVYTITAESAGVVNNNNGTQTGMLAFACDPDYVLGDLPLPSDVLLAAAWGQDPEFASVSSPGFDVGTTIRTGSTNRPIHW